MFVQYQEVRLKLDSFKGEFFDEQVELKKGQPGMVMDVLVRNDLPTGYTVEFFDENGETVTVVTMEESALEPVTSEASKDLAKGA